MSSLKEDGEELQYLIKPYFCYFCASTFVTNEERLSHIKQYHPLQNRYQCIFCYKEFLSLNSFGYHLMLFHSHFFTTNSYGQYLWFSDDINNKNLQNSKQVKTTKEEIVDSCKKKKKNVEQQYNSKVRIILFLFF